MKRMNIQEKTRIKKKLKTELMKRGIKKAALFGSVARGEDDASSDLDLLIEPSEGMTLMDLSGLKMDLEDLLGRRVDVITYRSIHPKLKEAILFEQEAIF